MYTGTILSRGKFLVMLLLLFSLCSIYIPAQVEWTKYENNPVLLPGSSQEWDEAGFAGQTVLYDSTEGIYKMWYGATDGFNFRIGYATSTDGIEWEKYNDPLTLAHPYAESDPVLGLGPGLFETTRVYGPIVLFDGTTYHMWYDGGGINIEQVGYATSTDGIAWVKDTLHNPVITPGPFGSWDDISVAPGPVQYDGTTFEMIYNGFDGSVFQAGYATSTDGFTWTKSDTVHLPVGEPGSWDSPRITPTAVTYNPYLSKYYLIYSAGEFGHWKIGYATADSFSGEWTKNPSPILEGTPGEWDEVTAALPYVQYYPDESIYKMWYMGSNYAIGASGGKIGYATAWVLDTLYVPNDYATIQEAINAASNGAVVLVDEGTYMENINFRGKAITVASRFFVDGDTSHIYNTVIDGSQPADPDSASVVSFKSGEDTTSVLCGFTITGGTGTLKFIYASERSGGGIFAFYSGAKIINNIIDENTINHSSDALGGGICLYSQGAYNYIIENNVISNNSVNSTYTEYYSLGGGIYTATQGYCRINNNRIINNSVTAPSGYGGGIEPAGGEDDNYWIINNYISGNIVDAHLGGSGAIDIYLHTLTVENNVIVNNTAPNAGGVYIDFTGDTQSLISTRGYPSDPGKRTLSIPVLLNNTIANNTALSAGGGVVSVGVATQILNCILWGNSAASGPQIYGAADVQYSDVEGGYTGTGNADWDPHFRDEANGDFHLMSTDCGDSYTSECIDAGDPAYDDFILDCDWGLGEARSDMGAYGGTKVVVGVEEQYLNIPTEYSLNQNYPNPFNPATTIRYSVPKASKVQIKIYDVLGNEIKTLINEEKPAGTYELNWNAANLTSGVYFYQIRAGEFTGTKKMILLK